MKVSIVGGGGLVGSTTAYALQCGGVVSSICLIDANKDLALGQATDLLHGASLAADQRISAGDMSEVASSNERLRRASDRVFRSWTDAAAARFTTAGIPPDDAEALAATAVAALEGAFMLARTRQDPEPLHTAGRHVRQLVEASLAAAAAAAAPSGRATRRPAAAARPIASPRSSKRS